MNTKAAEALDLLNRYQREGVRRDTLAKYLYNSMEANADRRARAAISALQKDGHDVISHNGRYYLLTADTPLEAVQSYIWREKAKATTLLKRLRTLGKRYTEKHMEPLP